jgi:hypothetical protein
LLKLRNGTGFNSLKGIEKVCKDPRAVLGSQFSVLRIVIARVY